MKSNEGGEWWWIYDTSMCKKPKLDKCSKNDDFFVYMLMLFYFEIFGDILMFASE
jgi:hypothetical protein